jgi:hypothetical protein
VHDCSLIGTATNQIRGDSNQSNHAENTCRPQAFAVGVTDAATSGRASNLKKVCALIHGADERRNGLVGKSITIAQKRHDRRLIPRTMSELLTRTR